MVKVTFNSALAQKEVKKDSETLIPDDKVTTRFRKHSFGLQRGSESERARGRSFLLYSAPRFDHWVMKRIEAFT